MFINILEILLQNDNLSLGNIIRISRLNSATHHLIHSHQLLWQFKSYDLGFKRKYDCYHIIHKINESKRCRECGHKNGLKAISHNRNQVYICSNCIQEKKSYSELVCRSEIFKNEGKIWSKKRRIILAGLHLARVGQNNKYYYWGFQWRQPLRRF